MKTLRIALGYIALSITASSLMAQPDIATNSVAVFTTPEEHASLKRIADMLHELAQTTPPITFSAWCAKLKLEAITLCMLLNKKLGQVDGSLQKVLIVTMEKLQAAIAGLDKIATETNPLLIGKELLKHQGLLNGHEDILHQYGQDIPKPSWGAMLMKVKAWIGRK